MQWSSFQVLALGVAPEVAASAEPRRSAEDAPLVAQVHPAWLRAGGLRAGSEATVERLDAGAVPEADEVHVRPETEDDWEMLVRIDRHTQSHQSPVSKKRRKIER